MNPYQGVWFFLERVAGFKLISIEPPRSSVHHVEEEGEGFCEQQKWNQEIGPKVLNFHPRLLNCPECTLLPKVMNFVFIFTNGEGIPVHSGEARLMMTCNVRSTRSLSWISVVFTHSYSVKSHVCSFLLMLWEKTNNWSLQWKCGLEFVLHFLCQFPCPGIHLVLKFQMAN